MQNVIPMLVGGVYRRPGTQTVDSATAVGSTGTTTAPRNFPFIASKTEAYCIQLATLNLGGTSKGDILNCKRIDYGTGALFVNSFSSSSATPYLPKTGGTRASSGSPDDPIFELQFTQSVDTMWLCHPDYKPKVIKRTGVDTFSYQDFDSGLSGLALAQAYPYLNQNYTNGTTITPSATTGGAVTLTASNPIFNALHLGAIFAIDGTGKVGFGVIIHVSSGTSALCSVISAFGSTSASALWWESAWSNYRGWPRACAIFQQRLLFAGTYHQPDSTWATATANYFKFSALNDTAPALTAVNSDGSTVTAAGGYINYPVDDSEGNGQSTGPRGGNPFRITLSEASEDQIQWLSPDKELLIGTSSQEWISALQNGMWDIGNSPTQVQSKYGSDYLQASRIGYELIFPMATKDEVRAYQYNYIDSSFFAEPVQLKFDNYPKPEIQTATPGRRKYRWMQWDVSRSTLWCVDSAGNFFGMTRDRKINVTMWHTHQLGGYDTTKGRGQVPTFSGLTPLIDPAYSVCDGGVTSFAVVPNPYTGVNDIWLVTKRSVSGSTFWSTERIVGRGILEDSVYGSTNPLNAPGDPTLVDCATLAFDNGDGTLTYNVDAMLNGALLTGNYYSQTNGIFKLLTSAVAAGVATITSSVPADYGAAYNVVSLGIPFNPIIQPVRIDVGSVIGTAQGAISVINKVILRFVKTMSALVGSPPTSEDSNPLERPSFRDALTPLAQSGDLYTGDKVADISSTYERSTYTYITQDQPLPFSLACIISEGEEFD